MMFAHYQGMSRRRFLVQPALIPGILSLTTVAGKEPAVRPYYCLPSERTIIACTTKENLIPLLLELIKTQAAPIRLDICSGHTETGGNKEHVFFSGKRTLKPHELQPILWRWRGLLENDSKMTLVFQINFFHFGLDQKTNPTRICFHEYALRLSDIKTVMISEERGWCSLGLQPFIETLRKADCTRTDNIFGKFHWWVNPEEDRYGLQFQHFLAELDMES